MGGAMDANGFFSCWLIEDLCSELQGIFNRKECGLYYDSLAPLAASGEGGERFRGSIPALHAGAYPLHGMDR
jgi:hypothetical protein